VISDGKGSAVRWFSAVHDRGVNQPMLYFPGIAKRYRWLVLKLDVGAGGPGCNGRVKLTATVGCRRAFTCASRRWLTNSCCSSGGGRGKLLTRRSGHALGMVGPIGDKGKPRDVTPRSRRNAPPITLTLHRISRRSGKLTLSLRRLAVRLPHGCQRVRGSTSLAAAPFRLEISL
jgi:hypothetical protein